MIGAIGVLALPGIAGAVGYVNERFDSVTQPALPTGFSAQTTLGTATWQTVGTQYFSASGAAFVADPATPADARLTLPPIDVPSQAGVTGQASVDFLSRYEFDGQNDGGVAEVSVDGAAYIGVDAADFTSGGYTGTIPFGTSNPLELRQAWTGSSGGSWNRVRILLDRFAGHQIRFRLRMGSGSGGSAAGWWIDNLRVLVPPAFGTPQAVVGATWAVVDTPLDPHGRPGLARVEYGETIGYGSASAPVGTNWSAVQSVPTLILGLRPERTVHYRGAVAFDDGETISDGDRSLITPAGASGLGETFDVTGGGALPTGWASFARLGGGGWVSASGGRTGAGALFLPNQSTLVDTSAILPTVRVPADATSAVLSFWQRYDFEYPYDAGSLEVSTDGGPFQAVSLADFDAGAPTETIQSGNPLAGRRAWTGTSPGGWEAVRVDLTTSAGHTVTYRLRAGTDSFGARPDGWRVDDLALTIVAPTPPPADPPPVTPPPTTPPPTTPPSPTPPSGPGSPAPDTTSTPSLTPDGHGTPQHSPTSDAAATGPTVSSNPNIQIRVGGVRVEVPRRINRARLLKTRRVRVRVLAAKSTPVAIRIGRSVRSIVAKPNVWQSADVRASSTLVKGRSGVSVTVLSGGIRRTVVIALA